ncbi:MAG: hypothetical protein E5V34_02940 [Mesorhizobium sp.]|nr:MAG: hypothetical protein E5V34_02940 [Mesorhizobium sp.]
MPACEWQLLRFRCSRTLSTLRSGSRKPPFSARPDLNLNTPSSELCKLYQSLSLVLGPYSWPSTSFTTAWPQRMLLVCLS